MNSKNLRLKFVIYLVSIFVVFTLVYNSVVNNILNETGYLNIKFKSSESAVNKIQLLQDSSSIIKFYNSFKTNEWKKYSQNKEDGVINELLKKLNMSDSGYYVEIGTQQGSECNTRRLREYTKWNGILLDGTYDNPSINLHKEIITESNVLDLFKKYEIQDSIDLLSEDTDYADYWIIEKILTKYRPKILIHEVNQQPSDMCVTVPKTDKIIFWDGSNYHGASVCAFHCLAKQNNYSMIYCESSGVNCFWLRNDIINYLLPNVDIQYLQSVLNPKFLYVRPKFTYHDTKNTWHFINCK